MMVDHLRVQEWLGATVINTVKEYCGKDAPPLRSKQTIP